MNRFLSLCLTLAMLSALLILPLNAAADIPEIPDGRYAVGSTALQLSEGIASETTLKAKTAVRVVPKLTATPLDISDKSYIYMWIYVSDASGLYDNNGDSIELCTGQGQDDGESAAYFYYNKAQVDTINVKYGALMTGWNEYLISISDFNVAAGGGLDTKNLNFIGVVLRSNSPDVTVAVGPMYAVSAGDLEYIAQEGTDEDKMPTGLTIHDFGMAKLNAADNVLSFGALCEPAGVGYYSYICIELFITGLDKLLTDASFSISSSADEDVQELSVNPYSPKLVEGRNLIFLKIMDFRRSGYDYSDPKYNGVCDLLNIRRLGVSWKCQSEDVSVSLGRVIATNSSMALNIPTGNYSVKDSAIAITSGECSASATASGTAETVRLIPDIEGGSVDITSKKLLYFWIYVSDITLDGCSSTESLELSSGGTCDERENAIRLSESNSGKTLFGSYGGFKTGWNEYVVPISALTQITNKSGAGTDGCDYSAVNYLRIYFRTVADTKRVTVTYTISTVWAVNVEDLNENGKQPETTAADTTTSAEPPQTQSPSGTTAIPQTQPQVGESTSDVTTEGKPQGGCGGSLVNISAIAIIMCAALMIIKRSKDISDS